MTERQKDRQKERKTKKQTDGKGKRVNDNKMKFNILKFAKLAM